MASLNKDLTLWTTKGRKNASSPASSNRRFRQSSMVQSTPYSYAKVSSIPSSKSPATIEDESSLFPFVIMYMRLYLTFTTVWTASVNDGTDDGALVGCRER